MCSASRPANNASASATYQHAVDELRASSTNNATSVLSCTPGEGALKTKLRKQDTQSSARIQLLGFDRAQLLCVWAMLTLIHAVAFGVSVSGSPRALSTVQQICVYLDRSSQRHAHRATYERDGYGEAAWAQPSSDEAPLRARARLRARIAVYLAGVSIGLISLAGFGQSYEAPNGVPAPGTRCGNSWGQADETPGLIANRTVVAAVVAWYGPGTQNLKWGWLYALTTYLALWTSFTSVLPPASALVSHEDVNIQHRRSAYPELELGYRQCCRIVNGELVQPYSKSFMWKVNTSVLFCLALCSLGSAYIELTLLHSRWILLFPLLSAHLLERGRSGLAALRASRFDEVAGGPRRTWWVHDDRPHYLCPPRYHTCDSMAIRVGLRSNRWHCPRGALRHRLPGAFV